MEDHTTMSLFFDIYAASAAPISSKVIYSPFRVNLVSKIPISKSQSK